MFSHSIEELKDENQPNTAAWFSPSIYLCSKLYFRCDSIEIEGDIAYLIKFSGLSLSLQSWTDKFINTWEWIRVLLGKKKINVN